MRRIALLLMAALALAAVPALAQEDEDQKERRKALEERLRGKTPQERKELLEKLRRLKEKTKREKEELRRKHESSRRIVDRLCKDLPADLEEKIGRLPQPRRKALLHHAVDRMVEVMRGQLLASLTRQERARLNRHEGRAWIRALMEIKKRKALERLPPEQRDEIEALPEMERRDRTAHLLRRVHEAERKIAYERVVGEMRQLLALSPEELDEKLRAPRIRRHVRRLGFSERELLPRLLTLSPPRLRTAFAELARIRKIQDPRKRRAALERFLEGLPE